MAIKPSISEIPSARWSAARRRETATSSMPLPGTLNLSNASAPPCMATSSAPNAAGSAVLSGRDFSGYFQFSQYAVWRRYRSAREHRRRVLHKQGARYGRKRAGTRFKAISSVPTPLAAQIGPAGSTAFPFRVRLRESSSAGPRRVPEHGRVSQQERRASVGYGRQQQLDSAQPDLRQRQRGDRAPEMTALPTTTPTTPTAVPTTRRTTRSSRKPKSRAATSR